MPIRYDEIFEDDIICAPCDFSICCFYYNPDGFSVSHSYLLALAFVNCHCKGSDYMELSALKLDGQACV